MLKNSKEFLVIFRSFTVKTHSEVSQVKWIWQQKKKRPCKKIKLLMLTGKSAHKKVSIILSHWRNSQMRFCAKFSWKIWIHFGRSCARVSASGGTTFFSWQNTLHHTLRLLLALPGIGLQEKQLVGATWRSCNGPRGRGAPWMNGSVFMLQQEDNWKSCGGQ